MQRHFSAVVLFVLFTGLPGILIAGELQRQHGAHVHGEATGSLAMDGDVIYIELDIPGINLVGFEHPPRTENQSETLERVIADLESGRWLMADARGECEMENIEVGTPGFGLNDDHDHHGHHHDHHHEHHEDHHHGHEHDDDHGHEHAEFKVQARINCRSAERLRWVDLELFADYPANETMRIDVLTETLATRARLGPSRARIDLR